MHVKDTIAPALAIAMLIAGGLSAFSMSVPVSQIVGTITTSVGIACQSATALNAQAQQAGILKGKKAASSGQTITKLCSRAGTRIAQGAQALDTINTAAAQLLAIAGAAGIQLPGVPGLK